MLVSHGGFIPYEVCGDEFSCLAAHMILQAKVSLMGMGILKRLSEINISTEEMARGNPEGYMRVRSQ